jgi:hypothetical protein
MPEGSDLHDLAQPLPAPAPGAIFRPVGVGGVIFSTETEIYFGVNAIGVRVWELLPPATATVGELCAIVAGEHTDASDEQVRADVRSFLDALIANQLVTTPSANAARHPAV